MCNHNPNQISPAALAEADRGDLRVFDGAGIRRTSLVMHPTLAVGAGVGKCGLIPGSPLGRLTLEFALILPSVSGFSSG